MTYAPIRGKCPVCHQDSTNTAFQAGAASRDAEIAELKVVSDHNLSTYHQAAKPIREERDKLREQVTLLRDALLTWGDKDTPLGVRIDTMVKALAATEPKGDNNGN